MHITILTYGSQGDVEPFVALGKGLRRAGYDVRLAAPEVFSHLVTSHGLDFVELPGDPEHLIRNLIGEAGMGWPGMIHAVAKYAVPLATEIMEKLETACADTDGVVHSFLLTLAGHTIARKEEVPDISAQLFPVFSETAEFPALVFPNLPLGPTYKRVTHRILNWSFWQASRLLYARLRRSSPHLPRLAGWPFGGDDHRSPPILYAFSRHVVPAASDWPDDAHVTGYWFLGDAVDWEPPEELTGFLETGSPPVCMGFGSTVVANRERWSHTVLKVLKLVGRRGIIVGAALDTKHLPADVFQIDYAPYEWLFPRTAAVIHHGGAGTTGKALGAGVPSVVMPFTSDQPFWGRRVHELRAGPRPIPASRASTRNLSEAIISATQDSDMRRRAESICKAMGREDGVGEAVRLIGRHLDQAGGR